jgi:16S rRNA (uracil1498-N3)-methyltransferase
MAVPRFYCPGELVSGGQVALPDQAAHHAAKVLRLRVGEPAVLFTGTGGEYEARVAHVGKHDVVMEVLAWREAERESPLRVTLAQAASAGEKMDFTLQKAVELGIDRIQPLLSERSVVRLSGERADKRVAHWQGVVTAACEQCGRNRVPGVLPLTGLGDWLGTREGAAPGLMLSPTADRALRDLPRPDGPVTLLVGPEGGFSDGELRAAERAGFAPVRLGPRVLRTETAALAALAAMQALWGDF